MLLCGQSVGALEVLPRILRPKPRYEIMANMTLSMCSRLMANSIQAHDILQFLIVRSVLNLGLPVSWPPKKLGKIVENFASQNFTLTTPKTVFSASMMIFFFILSSTMHTHTTFGDLPQTYELCWAFMTSHT